MLDTLPPLDKFSCVDALAPLAELSSHIGSLAKYKPSRRIGSAGQVELSRLIGLVESRCIGSTSKSNYLDMSASQGQVLSSRHVGSTDQV